MARDRERPQSPHLQVYRLPLNAILSILHRMTGVGLTFGLVLLVGVLITAAAGSQAYQVVQALLTHWLGQLVLLGFTLALYYHLCAGIRHLFWDAGHGYEPVTTQRTAWAVMGGAVVLTALTWGLALIVNGS